MGRSHHIRRQKAMLFPPIFSGTPSGAAVTVINNFQHRLVWCLKLSQVPLFGSCCLRHTCQSRVSTQRSKQYDLISHNVFVTASDLVRQCKQCNCEAKEQQCMRQELPVNCKLPMEDKNVKEEEEEAGARKHSAKVFS